ncbi:TIR domain-containing protein [Paenibacillus sp. Y5S-9]|uniref:TIR domain-containing protein n=1 Tax=Paenibacillus sp. Y5S-9 TaxID=3122489 RepID=UPI0030D2C28C
MTSIYNNGIVINGGKINGNVVSVAKMNVYKEEQALDNETDIAQYEYDVALSFAGEDRGYVEIIAKELESRGIKVFYDKFEEATLWGKDLHQYLDYLFGKGAAFCVMCISEMYIKKSWCNLERNSAIQRQNDGGEYILPVCLDLTRIEGITDRFGYLEARNYSPVQLVETIINKINTRKDEERPQFQKKIQKKPEGPFFVFHANNQHPRFGRIWHELLGGSYKHTFLKTELSKAAIKRLFRAKENNALKDLLVIGLYYNDEVAPLDGVIIEITDFLVTSEKVEFSFELVEKTNIPSGLILKLLGDRYSHIVREGYHKNPPIPQFIVYSDKKFEELINGCMKNLDEYNMILERNKILSANSNNYWR